MKYPCSATTKAGTPCRCRQRVQGDPPLCFTHDPTRAAERLRMQRRGGHARGVSLPSRIDTLEAVLIARAALWRRFRAGKLEASELSPLCRLLDAQERSLVTPLLARVKQLQRDLDAIKKRGEDR